jgi:hypothetical protein
MAWIMNAEVSVCGEVRAIPIAATYRWYWNVRGEGKPLVEHKVVSGKWYAVKIYIRLRYII